MIMADGQPRFERCSTQQILAVLLANGLVAELAFSLAAPRASDQVGHTNEEEDRSRRKPLRVLIADDHEALRRGLRAAMSGAGWQVCGEAANGREAVERTVELKPDVVVLDLSMPVMGGFDAAREIRRAAPEVKVVVFTMHESQQVRDETARIGVHALAVKSAPVSNLLETIRSVLTH
jgi:CheY-like chemotaxis protein